MENNILLGHGSGGKLMHQLLNNLFFRYFNHEELKKNTDSAILTIPANNIAFTTDSYVVDPLFFPGGNVGKLAICGTINDLAVSGAQPQFISAGFIIEEGFSLAKLEEIVKAMALEAKSAGVQIVTGDTKVINKGKADKVFINTSGIGIVKDEHKNIAKGNHLEPGDILFINGTLGDHAMAVLTAREDLPIKTDIQSDCACLNHLIKKILDAGIRVKFMRDLTRGGLATVLDEVISGKKLGIEINEKEIPIKDSVKALCEVLGFDPLYLANEGKVLFVVDKADETAMREILHNDILGKSYSLIGKITDNYSGEVVMNSIIGGKRLIKMLAGEQLPRIC
ncbi:MULTISPECIES: hydrogenase expression/formation protein HypE [unclassified Saccharicrinis]|uniref:hydrogenase expression/formation protein HypE n=1 Tax=unclassified Saccharicrinis TaxID=2646859 RepID=UPI003D346906